MWVMGGFTSSRSHDIFLVDRFHFLQLDTSYPRHTSHLVLTSPCTAPTSSSPPVGESLFLMYYVFKLTNALLLPPFQSVSPHLVMLCISKLINLLLSLPPLQKVSPCVTAALQ